MNYHIRAEFPGSIKRDFQVPAETLDIAKVRAENILCNEHQLPFGVTKFNWHGAVVFVDQVPAENAKRKLVA